MRIRKANKQDIPVILAISSLIWDGDDYIPIVIGDWIEKDNFYVAIQDRKIVGMGNVSYLPGKVAWLEGLRVHPDYQGKGIGKELNRFFLKLLLEEKKNGLINNIEFSTYYKNVESLHITAKVGFKPVEDFILLSAKRTRTKIIPEKVPFNYDLFAVYKQYIPTGWKFVQNCSETEEWLKKRGQIYVSLNNYFFVSGEEKTATLLTPPNECFSSLVPCLQYLSDKRGPVDLIVPGIWLKYLPKFREAGYKFWERPYKPNVIVFRYEG